MGASYPWKLATQSFTAVINKYVYAMHVANVIMDSMETQVIFVWQQSVVQVEITWCMGPKFKIKTVPTKI